MKTLEEREERERHRNQVVRDATRAAYDVISGGSDGSNEETNYLTAEVARDLMVTALHPFNAAMLHKDLED